MRASTLKHVDGSQLTDQAGLLREPTGVVEAPRGLGLQHLERP